MLFDSMIQVKQLVITNERHLRRLGQIVNFLKYRLSKKSILLKYEPITLSIAVTDRCNLNCDMCHAHSKHIGNFEFKHSPTKDVDFNLFKNFVDKFNKALNITMIGSGEPLLNNDFYKMVEYGTRVMKMRVSTNTNGMLLDGETIKKLLRSKLNHITISMNGNNEVEFNRMTGMGRESFKKILENITSLVSEKRKLNSNITIGLNFIIDKENYKKIPLMIILGETLGVDSVNFINFLPTPFPGFTAKERCIQINDIYAINFIDSLKKNKYKVRVVWPNPINLSGRKICEEHFTKLRLDGDGNIGGCTIKLLNLEKNGKYYDKDVWNNEYFQRMRSIFIDTENDRRLEPCRICPNSSS